MQLKYQLNSQLQDYLYMANKIPLVGPYEYFKRKFLRLYRQYKQKRLQSCYQKKNYLKLVKMFKTQKDYQNLAIDSFPFLYFMISEGNVEAVKVFIEKYPHKQFVLLHDNNPLKANPLFYSCLQNKQEITQLLEANGSQINTLNSQGQNLLHLSSIYKRKQAFLYAIQRNIDFNQTDNYGNTPLHYSCRVGHIQFITTLIAAKAKRIANKVDQYPIHMAVESRDLACVQLLQNDLTKSYPKLHPIHSAARCSTLQITKFIMQKNMKISTSLINMKDQNQLTPLHYAVNSSSEDIIKYLLSYQFIQVNEKDKYGNTPLHLAIMNQQVSIAKMLIEKRANLDVQNQDEMSPVQYGLNSNKGDMRKLLLDLKQKSIKLKNWNPTKW